MVKNDIHDVLPRRKQTEVKRRSSNFDNFFSRFLPATQIANSQNQRLLVTINYLQRSLAECRRQAALHPFPPRFLVSHQLSKHFLSKSVMPFSVTLSIRQPLSLSTKKIVPYKIELVALAETCKGLRTEVIEWWTASRQRYNLTRTGTFGKIDIDGVVFTLVIDHSHIASGGCRSMVTTIPAELSSPDCVSRSCPCLIKEIALRK